MDMIKGIKKRVGCFLLACSLSFGICSTDYLEVQALEWAGMTIGLETALEFLLGLLGITVGVGVAETVDWQTMRENCVDFQIAQGQSAVAVSNWWADVIHGAIDTGSDCWTSFKAWAYDLIHNNSSSGSTTSTTLTELNTVFNSLNGTNFVANNNSLVDSLEVSSVFCFWANYPANNSGFTFYAFTDPTFSIGSANDFGNGKRWNFTGVCSSEYPCYQLVYGLQGGVYRTYWVKLTSNFNFSYAIDSTGRVAYVYPLDFENTLIGSYIFEFPLEGAGSLPNEGIFQGDFADVEDIAIAPSIATDLPFDGVIEVPWENVGATDEAVDEAIDTAQDKVITGEWSLSQYWQWVQNVTNVFAYDITNEYLLPNDGSNEPADDKIQDNINRGAFVLAGLEKVFPFCIPWDIYAFVTLLVAEPVAPVIEYPIYNPVTKVEEVITIDFSVWEEQVIIMRYIMDFLLIIGLLLLARSLIGAGGSD